MPTGVLSKLVKLEELKLPLDFNRWGQEEGGGKRVNAKLNEIETLQLTSINIGVPKGSILAFKNITRFQISLGKCRSGNKGIPLDSNFLEFNNVDACDVTANWTHTLVRNCDWLEFVGVRELKYIMFQHELRGNNGFPCTYFSGVKTLIILHMESLEEIWDGPYFPNIQPPCFPNLTKVIIYGCRKLKHVFPFSVSAELRQLQHMEIKFCGEMEEIFYNDQEVDGNQVPTTTETTSTLSSNPNGHKPQLIFPQYDASRQILKESIDHVIVLPRLKSLLLRDVPDLRILCNGNHAIECPSLQELNIKGCDDLEAISYGPFSAPTTMRLELKDVRSLENIIKWLHFEQGNGIPHALTIKRCEKMKYLVDAIADHPNLLKAFFSPLEYLGIEQLDSLEAIWNGPPSNMSNIQPPCFPNLTSINISRCSNLTRLFPLSMATQLGQLQYMQIYMCREMEEIFYNDQSVEQHEKEDDDAMDAFIFPQLRTLRLLYLSKLRILIDENHTIELPSLEEFEINGCDKMEALSKGSFMAPKLEAIGINHTMYPCGDDLNTILTENGQAQRRGR